MLKITFAAQEETALSGHKAMKDRITLLLYGNASNDREGMYLIVHH